MPNIKAPPGVALTTVETTIWTNPSDSGRAARVQTSITNVDGVNDAVLNTCNFVDADPAGSTQVLPRLFPVKKADAVSFWKTLEPGDSLTATASANGDLVATVDLFFEPEEPEI